ncbi:glycosyltransferase family 9 protein [Caldimonas tepidiphila]|uniref:glycosyltransferase family 9 protein n=1 Tax=Caldimonas tepidiphila TaxID=2315841 RepID=UPI0013008D6A|nr:glycosyltransferase family 9 protein [Caldimonas tepidiphila]
MTEILSVDRICVFRALQLGDLVCATPALRALRHCHPRAHIALVGLPWARQLAERLRPWVDEVIAFPGHPSLPEQPAATPEAQAAFAEAMRRRRFDLALQMHGSGGVSNGIVAGFGARVAAGFHPPGLPPARPGRWWPYPESPHEVQRNLRLVALLSGRDVRDFDDAVAFPLTAADQAELQSHPALRDAARLAPGSFVCLHPGARDPARRWPAERFAQVGDRLAAAGYRIVVTGSDAERELASQVIGAMRAPALHAACDIGIGGLAALLARARLLVSNDTGVAHVAAGLALPNVVVFFASDPGRWAPRNCAPHRIVCEPGGPDAEAVGRAALEVLDAAQAAAA